MSQVALKTSRQGTISLYLLTSKMDHWSIIFQNIYNLNDTSNSTILPLIGLGAHTSSDNLAVLWENGAGTYDSDLITIHDLISTTTNQLYLNVSTLNQQPTVTAENSQNKTVMFCQSPLVSSFCIDAASLTAAMSTVG